MLYESDVPDFVLALPTWLQAILWVLIGGGGFAGVAAVYRAVADRSQGVSSHELAEDEAISARWKSIIDTQVEALIKPLKDELSRIKSENSEAMASMKQEQETMRTDLRNIHAKYWRAISHIRSLLLWISRNAPGVDTSLPQPAEEIMKDI